MKKLNFNHDWKFQVGGGRSLEGMMGEQCDTRAVTLPHDAAIEMQRDADDSMGSGNGFFRKDNYCYTKEFSLNPDDREKNIWIEFEGIYQNAFVYVNRSYVGKCPYGYSNFYLDITKYVTFTEMNIIKVIIKNDVASGRWYTGGGIYRDVNLMVSDRLHIIPDGVQLTTKQLEKELAVVHAEAEIEYTGTGIREVMLHVCLLGDDGKTVSENAMKITVEEHSKQKYQLPLYVHNPRLWDADNPHLYRYQAWIEEEDSEIDREEGTFGIRQLQLDTCYGLRVNGKTVKLRGGCIHHDNGIIGTAEFSHAAEDRIARLKAAGYNAIRSAHYPMSRKLLNACDHIGMYVMDEFSDVWTTTKVDFDYGIHMMDWWEHDVSNMVRKDYNHPCVLMYSIGNEIPETGNKHDVQWGKKIADKIRSLDGSRYVTNSLNLMLSVMDKIGEIMAENFSGSSEGMETYGEQDQEINSMMTDFGTMMNVVISSKTADELTKEAASQVDIVGYNYGAVRYEEDGRRFPNRILVGSETYSPDLDVNWELVEKLPYVLGDFSWTAWDYLGEAGIGKIRYGKSEEGQLFYEQYPCKAAYCGDINLIGDRRPISYWREIIWGLRQQPYIAVQPPMHHDDVHRMTGWSMTNAVRSWNWEGWEGKPVLIEVYSDAQEVEFYQNGKLVEKKKVGEKKKFQVFFETIYEPGKIEVVAYTEGKEVGRDYIESAAEPLCLKAQADREQIPADESDICYVDVFMTDNSGIFNPCAKKSISVTVDGPGVILGYGSADPESEENYFDRKAVTYEGRLRAAVRGTGVRGMISVTFSAEDMHPVSVQIEAV